MRPFALRRLSALGLAVCLGLVAVAAGRLHAGEAARPPNVVFILSDDQHWQDYAFMGHPRLRTPHLDRLARESLVFTRGYVPSSLCCPSLASIITGRYHTSTRSSATTRRRRRGSTAIRPRGGGRSRRAASA